jgi:hypothetical protein
MSEDKPKFRKFEYNPNFPSNGLQKQVDEFLDKFKSFEIVSQSQSQSGGFIVLCIFYKGILDDTE